MSLWNSLAAGSSTLTAFYRTFKQIILLWVLLLKSY